VGFQENQENRIINKLWGF